MHNFSCKNFIYYAALIICGIALCSHKPFAQENVLPDSSEFARAEKTDFHPHIAVILPSRVSTFRIFTQPLYQGILKAEQTSQNSLPILLYDTAGDAKSTIEAYNLAVAKGAKGVLGPLTRTAVSAILDYQNTILPLVTLNYPRNYIDLPKNIFLFGRGIQGEATQVAELAFAENGRKLLLVLKNETISRRTADHFKDHWISLNGAVEEEFIYDQKENELENLAEMVKNTEADTIFMALNSDDARKLRPYMGSRLPIYGTSLIFPTKSDRLTLHDLEGVRFVDMPLVVENISQNEESPLNDQDTQKWIEPERFYALGIDAYRIITHILKEKTMSTIEGVTGTLVLSPKQIIDRQGIAVHLSNGRVKIIRLEDDN